ncbi:hypothetical protein GCM10029976_024870 [Kribbella albertanoniae]
MGAIHAAARTSRYRVMGDAEGPRPGPTRNFYSVELRGEDVVELRLNVPMRVVAAVREVGRIDAPYCEVPGAATFVVAGFVVGTPEELNASVVDEHLVGLSKADLVDVKYHEPRTVGQILFNWFD